MLKVKKDNRYIYGPVRRDIEICGKCWFECGVSPFCILLIVAETLS
jgi:hypothetical protein